MANIFIDGFDLYSTGAAGTDSGMPWVRVPGNPTWNEFISTSNPITGTRCARIHTTVNSGGADIYRPINVSDTTLIVGFAVVWENISSSEPKAVSAGNGSNVFGVWQRAGKLVAYRNNSVLATGTTTLLQDVKYYVEFKFTDTTYEVLLDGEVELSGTMTSLGGAPWTRIRLYSESAGNNRGRIDDMYVNDSTGSINNDYLGEISVVALLPDADGTPQEWTPSTGSTAYEILDNVPPTSAYVEGENVDDELRVELPDIPFDVNQIHVVDLVYRHAKNGSGPCTIETSLIQNSVESTADSTDPAEGTYAWSFNKLELDPDTEAAWDPDTFNPTVKVVRTV